MLNLGLSIAHRIFFRYFAQLVSPEIDIKLRF